MGKRVYSRIERMMIEMEKEGKMGEEEFSLFLSHFLSLILQSPLLPSSSISSSPSPSLLHYFNFISTDDDFQYSVHDDDDDEEGYDNDNDDDDDNDPSLSPPSFDIPSYLISLKDSSSPFPPSHYFSPHSSTPSSSSHSPSKPSSQLSKEEKKKEREEWERVVEMMEGMYERMKKKENKERMEKVELSLFLIYCHLSLHSKADHLSLSLTSSSLSLSLHNTLLYYHCRYRSVKKSVDFFKQCMQSKHLFNSFSFSLLFLKLFHANFHLHSPLISELFQLMKRSRHHSTLNYNLILNTLIYNRFYSEASALFQQMLDHDTSLSSPPSSPSSSPSSSSSLHVDNNNTNNNNNNFILDLHFFPSSLFSSTYTEEASPSSSISPPSPAPSSASISPTGREGAIGTKIRIVKEMYRMEGLFDDHNSVIEFDHFFDYLSLFQSNHFSLLPPLPPPSFLSSTSISSSISTSIGKKEIGKKEYGNMFTEKQRGISRSGDDKENDQISSTAALSPSTPVCNSATFNLVLLMKCHQRDHMRDILHYFNIIHQRDLLDPLSFLILIKFSLSPPPSSSPPNHLFHSLFLIQKMIYLNIPRNFHFYEEILYLLFLHSNFTFFELFWRIFVYDWQKQFQSQFSIDYFVDPLLDGVKITLRDFNTRDDIDIEDYLLKVNMNNNIKSKKKGQMISGDLDFIDGSIPLVDREGRSQKIIDLYLAMLVKSNEFSILPFKQQKEMITNFVNSRAFPSSVQLHLSFKPFLSL